MKKLKDKIEAILTAETFAEAGEHQSALTFLQSREAGEEAPSRRKRGNMTNQSRAKVTAREIPANHSTSAALSDDRNLKTVRQIHLGSNEKQTVLLAIEGLVPNGASFDYTVNLCRRLGANLDILQMIPEDCVEGSSPSKALSDLFPKLEREKISFKVTVHVAKPGEILFDHVRSHKHVVTAVIDSPGLRDKQAAETNWRKIFRKITRKLSVPLVTALQREPW